MSADPNRAEGIAAAAAGDAGALPPVVPETQAMAYAVALRVLRKPEDAKDAVQDAYVTSFKRLPELLNPDAFAGWLRRIVVATALNQRRRTRTTWVPLTEASAPPLLDEREE